MANLRTNIGGGGASLQVGDITQKDMSGDSNYLKCDGQMLASGDTGYDALKELLPSSIAKMTNATTPFGGTNAITAVAYGNGVWTGFDAAQKCATSSDCVTWTDNGAKTSAVNRIWFANGMFVAVGAYYDSSDNRVSWIGTSTNGSSWSTRSNGFAGSEIWGVVYGNGTWVAVADYGKIATSTNGTTWVQRTSVSGNLRNVTYGNGLFVIAPYGGSYVYTSSDGITWTSRSTPTSLYGGLAFGNGRFVVSAKGIGGVVCVSNDGITWEARSLNSYSSTTVYSNELTTTFVAYANNLWIAGGKGHISISANADDWAQAGCIQQAKYNSSYSMLLTIKGVAAGEKTWVIFGGYGKLCYGNCIQMPKISGGYIKIA